MEAVSRSGPRGEGHNPYLPVSVVLLATAASTELARLLLQRPWPGLVAWLSELLSSMMVAVWITAIVALLVRRRARAMASIAWVSSIGAVVLMIPYGLATYVTGGHLAILYLPLAAVLAFFVRRMWAWHHEWEMEPTGEHEPA